MNPVCIARLKLAARRALTHVIVLCALLLGFGAGVASAQVSSAEIVNPQLKALEQTYLPQLKVLNRNIAASKFPFSFFLSRYVGLDPQQQAETDTRGVEFVSFHGRMVLKVTGNYNAAYNADLMTQNQRAARTFQDVVVPMLRLVVKEIPADVGCHAIGFEVSYHVRRRQQNSDYEGKEILVVIFDREDAFGYESAKEETDRQEVLNRSEIYVNGKEYGLALGQRDPLDLEALGRGESVPAAAGPGKAAPATSSAPTKRVLRMNPGLPAGLDKAGAKPGGVTPGSSASGPESSEPPAAAATQGDAERLQAQDQGQLDALAKGGVAGLEFVGYAPPSFVVFHNQIYLQLTLRNPLHFEKGTGSIYKRAAQGFDLFLALHLRALLEKIPSDAQIVGLDITLLNQLEAKPGGSSEALEFALPLKPLRQFVAADITNQELINQSLVLVNGVRIALNLQQVE